MNIPIGLISIEYYIYTYSKTKKRNKSKNCSFNKLQRITRYEISKILKKSHAVKLTNKVMNQKLFKGSACR